MTSLEQVNDPMSPMKVALPTLCSRLAPSDFLTANDDTIIACSGSYVGDVGGNVDHMLWQSSHVGSWNTSWNSRHDRLGELGTCASYSRTRPSSHSLADVGLSHMQLSQGVGLPAKAQKTPRRTRGIVPLDVLGWRHPSLSGAQGEVASISCRTGWLHSAQSELHKEAEDQNGCSMLIAKWHCGDQETRTQLLNDVLPVAPRLAMHHVGRRLLEAVFSSGDLEQRRLLVERLAPEVTTMSMDKNGCRVVQHALQRGPNPRLIAEWLRESVSQCIMNIHANHVIQNCVEVLPPSDLGFIVDGVLQFGVQQVTCDKFGCRVVLRLLEHCPTEAMVGILDGLKAYSYGMLTDPFGNYVLQHILTYGRLEDRVNIFQDVLRCDIACLKEDKHAANVLQKCIVIFGSSDYPPFLEQWERLCVAVTAPVDDWVTSSRAKARSDVLQLMLRVSTKSAREQLTRQIHLVSSWYDLL